MEEVVRPRTLPHQSFQEGRRIQRWNSGHPRGAIAGWQDLHLTEHPGYGLPQDHVSGQGHDLKRPARDTAHRWVATNRPRAGSDFGPDIEGSAPERCYATAGTRTFDRPGCPSERAVCCALDHRRVVPLPQQELSARCPCLRRSQFPHHPRRRPRQRRFRGGNRSSILDASAC
jgi:hypothetical protein